MRNVLSRFRMPMMFWVTNRRELSTMTSDLSLKTRTLSGEPQAKVTTPRSTQSRKSTPTPTIVRVTGEARTQILVITMKITIISIRHMATVMISSSLGTQRTLTGSGETSRRSSEQGETPGSTTAAGTGTGGAPTSTMIKNIENMKRNSTGSRRSTFAHRGRLKSVRGKGNKTRIEGRKMLSDVHLPASWVSQFSLFWCLAYFQEITSTYPTLLHIRAVPCFPSVGIVFCFNNKAGPWAL